MADRGRDLKISILSDVSKFDLDGPARDLQQLGRESKDAADEVGKLASESKTASRDIDRAFDAIGTSAHTAGKKVKDDLHDAGHEGFKDFKDEAHQSGREAAASFSGGFDDLQGFVQETAANAFGGFGPGGAALGLVAAAGIGIAGALWSKSQEDAAAFKQQVTDLFQAMVDGAGRVQESSIQSAVDALVGDPDKFKELKDQADAAHVSIVDYARAQAGSIPDIKKVSDSIDAQKEAMGKKVAVDIYAKQELDKQGDALDTVADKLGITKGAVKDAQSQWEVSAASFRQGVVAPIDVDAPTPKELANEYKRVSDAMGRPIPMPLVPTVSYAAAAAERNRMQTYFSLHPVTVPVKPQPGQGAGYGVVHP